MSQEEGCIIFMILILLALHLNGKWEQKGDDND